MTAITEQRRSTDWGTYRFLAATPLGLTFYCHRIPPACHVIEYMPRPDR